MVGSGFLIVLLAALCSCEPPVSGRQYDNAPSTANNLTNEYFALTKDGRLERIQLVFPEKTQVQMAIPATDSVPYLLTPDGRLEKLQEERRQPSVVNYFKLTEDGRLEAIRQEDMPTDVVEESGEYHVLLPSGSLQRVRFMTKSTGSSVSAKVQYKQVEPIRGPIYQYAKPLIRIV